MKYSLYRTADFEEWYEELNFKERAQIVKRLSLIESDGHFGDHKNVGDEVWELRKCVTINYAIGAARKLPRLNDQK